MRNYALFAREGHDDTSEMSSLGLLGVSGEEGSITGIRFNLLSACCECMTMNTSVASRFR